MKRRNIAWILSSLLIGALVVINTGCSDDDDGASTTFTMPGTYLSGYDYSQFSAPGLDGISTIAPQEYIHTDLPGDKKVVVYFLSEETFDALGDGGTFESEISFIGKTKTGGTSVKFKIPAEFKGVVFYPFALVILNDEMANATFEGKTNLQILTMTDDTENLVLGILRDKDGDNPAQPLSFTVSADGGTVEIDLIDLKFFASNFMPR